MSFAIEAPQIITLGDPIPFRFTSEDRVSGRVRLTAGTEEVPFRLQKGEEDPSDVGTAHRIRGKGGDFKLLDWGTHKVGDELVLRFEGRKVWMTVGATCL